MIETDGATLTPAAAEAVLNLNLANGTGSGWQSGPKSANHGYLTAAEPDKSEAGIAAADLPALRKSKARRSLKI